MTDAHIFDLAGLPTRFRPVALRAFPRPLWGNRTIYLLWCIPVGAVNVLLAAGVAHDALSTGETALLNLLLTVLLRNDQVVVALNQAAVALPLRNGAAKYVVHRMVHQLGGAHAAAGLATLAWLSVACAAALRRNGAGTEGILAAANLALLALVAATAVPAIRHARHELFERTHRFGGWTSLALAFAQAAAGAVPSGAAVPEAAWSLLGNRSFLLVAATAALVVLPWLRLAASCAPCARLVGGKVVQLTFPARGYCRLGSFVRISLDRVEWHSFAVALEGHTAGGVGRIGVLIATAGDWTRSLADRIAAGHAPVRMWARRVKPPGFMHSINAYDRTVVVATGAGIAPALLYVTHGAARIFLIWIAADPDATFGDVAATGRNHPHVLVHDTTRLGRPDTARLALDAARSFGAEAVFCVSNPSGTREVLDACLARGIPAYGATWDS